MIKSFGWEIDTINSKKYYRVVTSNEGIKDFKTEKAGIKFMIKHKSKYGMI